MEAKKAGARVYPTNEAFAQALKTEEIGIGIMWKARVVQWQNAGISVQSVAPAEGVPMYVSGFVIPKNAPNKEGGYAYMNAMLEKSAQENFAVDMGYNPTVTNATRRAGPAEAHRLHRRGTGAAGRPRLRLSRQERLRDEGVVGQGVQGLSRAQANGGLTAAGLVGPATVYVGDRHPAAARDPVSLQPECVRARQVHGRCADGRELRQVLHRHLLLLRC